MWVEWEVICFGNNELLNYRCYLCCFAYWRQKLFHSGYIFDTVGSWPEVLVSSHAYAATQCSFSWHMVSSHLVPKAVRDRGHGGHKKQQLPAGAHTQQDSNRSLTQKPCHWKLPNWSLLHLKTEKIHFFKKWWHSPLITQEAEASRSLCVQGQNRLCYREILSQKNKN